jgi:ABC-2 type transport system permease protein
VSASDERLDVAQWKALTAATLKMDLRGTKAGAHHSSGKSKVGGLIGLTIFYFIAGGFSAGLIFISRDVMLSGTVVLSALMFLVAAMVLLDHGSVITAPDDYVVLGSRPVNSRTYLAVRITNVLVYTAAVTAVFGIIPIVAMAIVFGWLPGLAAVAAFALSGLFVSLLLVAGYAWILRVVGTQRLERALSYLQLVMGFLVYGGYFAVSSLISEQTVRALRLPDSPLVWLYPPTWFASYLALASGLWGAQYIAGAMGSLVLIGALLGVIQGRLSMNYAEHLGAVRTASIRKASASARRRQPFWFATGEGRAIALLVRAQFKHEQKFRMAVLGALPLTVLYVLMSLRHGPLPDPFAMDFRRAADIMLITVAIVAFPVSLRMTLSNSDSFKASWIYFASPADRARLVRATKNVISAFFLAPYLAFVTLLLQYFSAQPIHVLVHMTVIGLFSHLCLQGVMLLDPTLPFSRPTDKTARSMTTFLTIGATFVVALVSGPVLALFVYVSQLRIAALIAGLIAASVLVDRLTRVRVERLSKQLEFAG